MKDQVWHDVAKGRWYQASELVLYQIRIEIWGPRRAALGMRVQDRIEDQINEGKP